MDGILNSLTKQGKKLKHRLRGKEYKPDKRESNAAGEVVDSLGSLLRPEPRVAAGGHDGEESGISTGGSDEVQKRREADVDEEEVGHSHSHLDPDVKVTAGSGPSQEVEQVYPSPPIPSIPPTGELADNNADASAIPDHVLEGVPSDKTTEPSTATNENKSNWRSTTSAAAKLLLRGVRDSADAFGPLKSVAGGLCFILENRERTKANSQVIESLVPRVKSLAELLCEPVPEADVKEGARRKKLEQKLERVCRDLVSLGKKGKVEDFFNNVENADKLDGLVEDVRDAIMEYQTSLQQDIYNKSCRVIESTDLALLNAMYHSPDAGYRCGNRQGCLRGTRKDVLWEIEHWLTGEQHQRVFWLNGLAGTGKSTIAQTFAETTFADGKLGASFFCSRDFADRNNLQMIFPTLSFQLAYRYPLFREELLQVLKAIPDVGRESLCSQMEKLIVGPLRATHVPTLIIIDALDECKDEEPASAILSVLSRYTEEIPDVKFFITGRPEPRIRSGFRLESLRPITEVFRLHDVERFSVDSDIKLFFKTQLTNIAKTRSDCDFTQDWPNPSDISILCEKAAGFFIYASTVVKFVAFRHRTPTEQLERIISLPQSTAHEGRSGIDLLYTQVLEQAVADVGAGDEEIHTRFKTVVGAVLLVFNSLSVRALSDLLRMSSIPTTLHSLHSLLLIPVGAEDPIHAFHKSFPDFLTDSDRCKDERFFVEPAIHHVEILLSCLRFMKEKLKKNICGLDDYVVLSGVKDISARRKANIGDALGYACNYWTKHLLEVPGSSPCIEEVQRAIDQFFTTHLLHWIEVLVLLGNLDVGVYAINDIEQWCTSAGVLSKWTCDSQHFLLEHFDTIHDSPSHIYHSALPLSPSSSLFHKHYGAELSHEVKVVQGLPAGWGTCSRTVSLSSHTQDLSFWNNTIAAGSKCGDIIFLDAVTGSQTAVLSGHTGEILSLTFSSDGKSLVSGSRDKTVKLWDVQTGGTVKTFHGHTGLVYSVSISADYARIASGAFDNTIRLWDIQTEECHCIIEHQSDVYHVSFSPKNPQHLLSISNGKVWQWNINGHQAGPTYDGFYIAFSSDGTQFVTYNKTAVVVQNSSSGVIVAAFHVANGAKHCCFSPNGKHIAVATESTAYIWDISSSEPHLIETFIGHTRNIASLAFSSPSSFISASYDKSVKFWQIGASGSVSADPKSTFLTSTTIESITLQGKDGIIITSDPDGVVRTWDILTGLCKASFQTPAKASHKRDVQLINSKLIFVWYADGMINIWDAEKGILLLKVEGPDDLEDLRMSGDGSRVFCLSADYIQAWSIQTGEVIGRAGIEFSVSVGPFGARSLHVGSLTVDGSRVWAHYSDSAVQGWDFGILGSLPIQLPNIPPDRLHPNSVVLWDTGLFRIKDKVTGKVLFQLSKRYGKPVDVQWNSQYLVAYFIPTKVLVLDFSHMLL